MGAFLLMCGHPVFRHSVRISHPKVTYIAVKLLLSIIEENEAFAHVMMANRGDWQWLDQWLKVCTSCLILEPFILFILFLAYILCYAMLCYSLRLRRWFLDSQSYIGKKSPGFGAAPPLARQESREQTFTKYQAQVLRSHLRN